MSRRAARVHCSLCGLRLPELPSACAAQACPLAGAIERRRAGIRGSLASQLERAAVTELRRLRHGLIYSHRDRT